MNTMLKYAQLGYTPLESALAYDDDFFDDVLGMFPNSSGYAPKSGRCGKYIYDENNWSDFIAHSQDYYPAEGERSLMQEALKAIDEWNIPLGTSCVDFGVGGRASFERNALPIIKHLKAETYYGVDFCEHFLRDIQRYKSKLKIPTEIRTHKLDLFFYTNTILTRLPSLGIMNGLTLGNMGGSLLDNDVESNLICSIKYLSQLCNYGWLLLTIDTNQNERLLKKAYIQPENERFCLNILTRIARELPTKDFDASRFVYDVEFFPETQLLAHFARATESQDFMLGPYWIHVEKGQQIHLLNSYKFRQEFFESCCPKANLDILNSWRHDSGVMLYLLKAQALRKEKCPPWQD